MNIVLDIIIINIIIIIIIHREVFFTILVRVIKSILAHLIT